MAKIKSELSRREFLASSALALGAAGFSLTGSGAIFGRDQTAKKQRVALVGTGIRGSSLWGRDLIKNYADVLEIVGLSDINPIRLDYAKTFMGATCPTFTDFGRMIEDTRPDTVIVTTMDSVHAKYIRLAMESGCRPITEKPMCTDEKMVQDIIDAERRTGRALTVTFNYRYSPDAVRIKEILMSGEIGKVTSVDFNWYLDVYHGASYFRRWHGFKQNSGSLLVHKASHHFDLMNWWLEAEPVEVHAYGELRKYGHNGAFRGERCLTCPHKSSCEFFWDITRDAQAMNLYVKAEPADGYIRDSCVFRNKINIWDTMSVQVRYHNRVPMSYSLNAFMPYEGYHVGFNGTKGRLDVRAYHSQPWKVDTLAEFRLTRSFKASQVFALESGGGGHWGADRVMQDQIFRAPKPDPLGRKAGSRDGALSALVGIAARHSIEQGRPIKIDELVKI
ncbi:MAG: Gfo/Idh/MocA family oxidoreductase [Candidatus Aminicenantes bacterium]|nr:Gfo/Idh/MocA family oxidoreductase [Candidatus Aminicenantes bacterium]